MSLVEHRPSAGLRTAGWLLVVLGLLVAAIGGYLLSHFIRIGPSMAIAYIWSGSLVAIGAGIAIVAIWMLRQSR